MIFLHPIFLYLMLPLLFILFYMLMTQKDTKNSFFSEEVLAKLRVNSNMLTLKARNGIFLLAFVLMIVALAEPVIEDGKVKVHAKSADIMIALDISDSMLAKDMFPSRLKSAKEKILTFLHEIGQERVGVIAFAKEAYMVSPLSFDKGAVAFLLKQLEPSSITEKGTNYLKLLSSADEMLHENQNKNLLIFTDGGDSKDFSEAIELAKNSGIKVFVVAMGTKQGAPIPTKSGGFIKKGGKIITSKLNTSIKALALQTGGAYVESVNSNADVEAMLKEIRAKTTKVDLKEEEINRYIPLFYYPLYVALVLLVIATSSMSKRRAVAVPNVLVFTLLLLHVAMPLKASLLDFTYLSEAKKAYEEGDFNRSSALYSKVAYDAKSNDARYNAANADYKMKRYDKALKEYENVHFDDKKQAHQKWHNMGNAQVKLGKLKEAVKSYEKALKLQDDKQTKENLEMVKKALEEQKKQQQQQKQNQKNRDKKQDKQNQNSQGKNNQKNDNKEKKGQKNHRKSILFY